MQRHRQEQAAAGRATGGPGRVYRPLQGPRSHGAMALGLCCTSRALTVARGEQLLRACGVFLTRD